MNRKEYWSNTRGESLRSADQFKLVLEDGTEFPGVGFGARKVVGGEVVFNTAMNGYVEALTDPSYRGQILVATYPLVGNYGVPPERPPDSVIGPYESDAIQVSGLVVQAYAEAYSHHTAARCLGSWLVDEEVPAVTGIDTRALTRRLREHGTMKGWLFPAEIDLADVQQRAHVVNMEREVFHEVASSESRFYGAGTPTVLLVDVGAKDGIIRSLLERGASVLRVPWHARLSDHAGRADGIIIGNGPGDPKDLTDLVEQVRGLLGEGQPVFGLCLGNQILARAAGGDTYKLPYGHRGVNQPVQDLRTRRCYITSQNHGYAVRDGSLPADWDPWFINVNDRTNEGIRARKQPFLGVQFHPEAGPGPGDTTFLFDEFLNLARASRRS